MERARRLTPPTVLAAAALVVLVLASYLPTLSNGFVWDDDDHPLGKASRLGLDGLRSIWLDPSATPQYYPLTHTTFWIENKIWGAWSGGYHLVNALLHAGCALLVWRVLVGLGVPGAWLAAAIFAVHPVHVETVAWAAERKNTLSGVFYLASLLLWVRLWLAGEDPEPRARRGAARSRRGAVLAFALFCCALLSKTVTATLPAVVALLLWWKGRRFGKRQILGLGAMLAAGGLMGLVTVHLEMQHVGAAGSEWSLPLLDRFLLAGRVPWFYLGKLAWPSSLTFVYPRFTIDPASVIQYLPLAGAVAALGVLFLGRARLGKGPFTAFACFVVTLFPALGFVNVYPMRFSYVADHFQYLASIAPIALAAAAAAGASRRWSHPRAADVVATALVVLVLGALTWRQCHDYRDEETLWRATLKRNPGAWMVRGNLAKLLVGRGDSGEAVGLLREALRSRPDEAELHNMLGGALLQGGDVDGALEAYRAAIRINPRSSLLHYNLGNALWSKGLLGEAIGAYRESLRIAPRAVPAWSALASVLFLAGDLEGSRQAVENLRALGGAPRPELVRELEEALRGSPPPAPGSGP